LIVECEWGVWVWLGAQENNREAEDGGFGGGAGDTHRIFFVSGRILREDWRGWGRFARVSDDVVRFERELGRFLRFFFLFQSASGPGERLNGGDYLGTSRAWILLVFFCFLSKSSPEAPRPARRAPVSGGAAVSATWRFVFPRFGYWRGWSYRDGSFPPWGW